MYKILAFSAWNPPARQPGSIVSQYRQNRLSCLTDGFYAFNTRISYKMYSEPWSMVFNPVKMSLMALSHNFIQDSLNALWLTFQWLEQKSSSKLRSLVLSIVGTPSLHFGWPQIVPLFDQWKPQLSIDLLLSVAESKPLQVLYSQLF